MAKTMNISLTPQLARYVNKKVKSGDYLSASEVMREALRVLQARDSQLESLRKEIRKGLDQLDRGEGVAFNEALVADIHRRGMQRLAKQKPTRKSA